ncbi:hypothetical protein BY458DRAFT_538911 [Sporodiniella umbellata]|nr:hypothetical protein BY458DRAFT_538911 [Sporodiniella umbellata]
MHPHVLTQYSIQSDKQTSDKHSRPEQEACDDNVTIGSILKRSATARHPGEKANKSLTRSTSHANLRKSLPTEGVEDQELQLAVQRLWAVLESDAQPTSSSVDTRVEPTVLEMNSNTGRIQTVKTLTTKIYIEDANQHTFVPLTNMLTSAMVVQSLKKKGLLDTSNDWAFFEIANSHLVERPMRTWEIVLDIISGWQPDSNNALLVKRYPYHHTLTSETLLQKPLVSMHGWLSIEYKKGKWQKRYCFIKDNAIHHAKEKGAISSILCHLASYDVYTLLQPLDSSPTQFVFAIRAQEKASKFEKEGDYIRFMATEDQEEMKRWVLGIRQTKSTIHHQCHPQRVMHPLSPVFLEERWITEECTNRRNKSGLSPSESTRRLERAKSKRSESEPRTEENEEENNTTPLIQINHKIQFVKGSLLAQGEPEKKLLRSKSVRELSESKKQVLRRKQTRKKLPESAITLLQLEETPERFHSRELHGRHVKPLLNFDTRK